MRNRWWEQNPLATLLNQHNSIGQDLLAMCVNDVITTGADPILFLDYLATGSII